MAIKDIKNLKEKFSDGIEPHGSDFGDIFDSFFHKSTKLPRTQILGLNKTLDSKADKKELDNIAAGMIYKPPVPTVAALTTTYPVAKKCWAVKVTADGFIYQFDGEIWNNTGLTVFPDNVATLNDLSPIERQVKYLITDKGNMTNDIAWVDGYYLDGLGVERQFDAFSYTKDYIPIKSSTNYTLQCTGISIIWYDFAKNVIASSGLPYDGIAVRTFMSPANATYCRCNQDKLIKDRFLIVKGEQWIDAAVKKGVISLLDLKNIETGCNYNADDVLWVDSHYLDITGAEKPFDAFSYTKDYIPVKSSTNYTLQCSGISVIWYDFAKNVIGSSGLPDDVIAVRTFMSPSNATYCRCNLGAAQKYDFLIVEGNDLTIPIYIPGLIIPTTPILKKQTIAWFGTSIPAGHPHQYDQEKYSYANRVSKLLGARIQNNCVPNGCIRSKQHDGSDLGGNRDSLSFTNLTSEINYKRNIIDLIGTADEPDLFVFDYGVNDIDADPWELQSAIDPTTVDCRLFRGALNFVLKKLFEAKPRARVVVLTHFSDDGIQAPAHIGKSCWKPLNDLIVDIAEFWNIPVVDLRSNTGFFNNGIAENLSLYCPDGIHPASDVTLQSVEILTKIVYEKIKQIV